MPVHLYKAPAHTPPNSVADTTTDAFFALGDLNAQNPRAAADEQHAIAKVLGSARRPPTPPRRRA